MRTKAELIQELSYYTKAIPSTAGLRIASLLDAWLGLHHIDQSTLKKVEWDNPRFCVLKISKFSCMGCPATVDGDVLTSLVFLAHDHCIRVSIAPCNPQFLEFVFHPRSRRDREIAERHPTLERALAGWRRRGNKSLDFEGVEFATEKEMDGVSDPVEAQSS